MFTFQIPFFVVNSSKSKLPVLRESDADLQRVPRNVVRQVPDLLKFSVRAFEVKVRGIPNPIKLICLLVSLHNNIYNIRQKCLRIHIKF